MKVIKKTNNYTVKLENFNECRIFDEFIRHSADFADFETIEMCIDDKNIDKQTIKTFIEELYQKFSLFSTSKIE